MKQLLYIILIVVSSCIAFAQSKNVPDLKVYKVGLPNVPGIMFRNENGEPSGFPIEIVENALKDENIKYIWVDGTWNELFEKIKTGEIDMLPGTQVTDDRKEYLDYLENSLYTIWSELYIHHGEKFRSVSDLENSRVGLVKGDNNALGFEKYISGFHINYIPVYFDSHNKALNALKNQEIYALAGPSNHFASKEYEELTPSGLFFNPTDLNVSFPKDKNTELRKAINKRIAIYKADPNSTYNILVQKYGLTDFRHSHEVFPQWVAYVLVIAVIVSMISVAFIVLLRLQVNSKTKILSESKELMSNAMEMGQMGSWEIDFATKKIYRTSEFMNLFNGKRHTEILDLDHIFDNIHPEDLEKAKEIFKTSLETGKLQNAELKMIKANGEVIYTNHSAIVKFDKEGKPLKMAGITKDINERKLHEYQLIAAKEKAEESENLKSAFLANMSHEIRTPLNAIVGFSNLLAKDDIDPEEKRMFRNIIGKQNDLLLNLINDIIDFAKIESGTLDMHIKEISDIPLLVDEVFEAFNHSYDDEIDFRMHHGKFPGKCHVKADPNRIKQIINNFVSNSFKYTEKGFIEIGCRFNHEKKHIEIYVKDSGKGIPADKQKEIFERFIQLDSYTQGTGLGLSISKYLAEKMGGRIELISEPGIGSEFILILKPIKIALTDELSTAHKQEHESGIYAINKRGVKRILIAEDINSNFLVLKNILKSDEFELTWVKNGEEAVKLFTESSFHLVLMDLKMPVMDGLEATKIIKKHNKHVPVIAVTAYALEADKEAAYNAGCDDFIPKPVEKNLILNKIKSFLN